MLPMPLRAVRGEESGRGSDIIAVNSHNDAEDKGLPAVDRGIVGVFGHEPDHVLFKLKAFFTVASSSIMATTILPLSAELWRLTMTMSFFEVWRRPSCCRP